jgi:hypothetical protein
MQAQCYFAWKALRTEQHAFSALRGYEHSRRRVTARAVRAAALFGRIPMIERQPALGYDAVTQTA